MIAEITKIKKKPSRYGGYFYYVFFKSNKGKSYYSCLYPKMRNFIRWRKVLKVGTLLKNLHLVRGHKNIIDADSKFKVINND